MLYVFVSCQDSVLALQALTRYSDMAGSGVDIDLSCVVTSEVDESFHYEHRFLTHNALVKREVAVSCLLIYCLCPISLIIHMFYLHLYVYVYIKAEKVVCL